ncbi:MAG: cobalamin biosynthesis protein CobQ, partial [Pseudomonadota bacterium]
MNTPAHLIIGAAAFGRPDAAQVTLAALLGGFLPDASLYLMAGVAIFGMGISPEVVFRDLYFSDAWQQVFAIDNSFVLW